MGKPGNIVPQQKYFRICWETFLLPAKIGLTDWLHSRVDLSEVNISRIWKFSKDETVRL